MGGYPGVYTQTSYFINWIMENADLGPPPTTTTTQAPTEEPTVPTTTLPPFECPSGWVDANPGCFRLEFNSSLTRHDALLLCESMGGFLAEPKSQDQVTCWQGLLSWSLTSLVSTPGGSDSLTRVTRAGGCGNIHSQRRTSQTGPTGFLQLMTMLPIVQS